MYGVKETNPTDNVMRAHTKDAHDSGIVVEWNDKRLKRIVRLRLLSDPGYPYWDVSYCVGELKDGTAVRVDLPFDRLPRKNMRGAIVTYAKKDRVFAQGIGVFDAISTLL